MNTVLEALVFLILAFPVVWYLPETRFFQRYRLLVLPVGFIYGMVVMFGVKMALG